MRKKRDQLYNDIQKFMHLFIKKYDISGKAAFDLNNLGLKFLKLTNRFIFKKND